MPADYAILAPVYEEISMAAFARSYIPKIINFALQNDWMGRRIIDLGCGSGAGIEWLAEHGYVLSAVDQSPQMLTKAKTNPKLSKVNVRWIEGDLRDFPLSDAMDMALAINVLNEFDSLKDMESVFRSAHRILGPQKLFIFDLMTLRGLVESNENGDGIIHDTPQSMIFGTSTMDFERQVQTQRYVIFQNSGGAWQKQETRRALRSFPIQGVAALLQRCGFNPKFVLTTTLERFDPNKSDVARVIFMAEKQ